MKKLLIILSLVGMASISIAEVQQVRLSNPQGLKATSYFGRGTVTGVGDLNQDGIDDFAVSGVGTSTGPTEVIYGGETLPSNLVLSQIQEGNLAGQGFNISCSSFFFGVPSTPFTATGADVNNDGHLDLLLVVSSTLMHIVALFGQSGGFSQSNNNLQYNEPPSTTAFPFANVSGFVASRISSAFRPIRAFDFNGDGLEDIQFQSSSSNAALVLFGASGSTYQDQLLAPTSVGSGGVVFPQTARVNATQSGVVGDINNDGLGDMLVGPFTNATHLTMNVYYGSVTYGNNNVTGLTVPTSSGNLVFSSSATILSIGSAGDFNGDGIDDLIAGDTGLSAPDGKIYVVYGNSLGIGSVDVENMPSNKGFVINGLTYRSTSGVAAGCPAFSAVGIGDRNGDGRSDLGVIRYVSGEDFCSGGNVKSLVYIIFGNNAQGNIYLNDTNTFNGVVIVNDNPSTFCPNATACDFTKGGIVAMSLNSLGDIDGTGTGDFAVAYSNSSYIVYGDIISGGTSTTGAAGTTSGTTDSPFASASSELVGIIAIFF